MTISNVYLIFWGPFKFGGPVRSHGPHVLRYGPASLVQSSKANGGEREKERFHDG